MDIARPEIKRQKRRRQMIWGSVALIVLVGATVGISRLKPASPTVDRSTIWTDTVKRGPMLRQVRGLGSLIPSHEDVRQIPAETEATVLRIVKLPGSQVDPDTVVVEMSNGQMVEDVRLALNGTRPVEFLGRTGGNVPSHEEVLEFVRARATEIGATQKEHMAYV